MLCLAKKLPFKKKPELPCGTKARIRIELLGFKINLMDTFNDKRFKDKGYE